MEWNKVTTFSKTIALALVFVVFGLGLYVGKEYETALSSADTSSATNLPGN